MRQRGEAVARLHFGLELNQQPARCEPLTPSLNPDVFIPQFWKIANEILHQLNAFRVG